MSDTSTSFLLSEEELKEKKSWMQLTMATKEKGTRVESYLCETFENRRKWIEEAGPSILEIVEEYPMLFKYDGAMIELEYEAIMGKKKVEKENFLGLFSSFYAQRIIAYAKKNHSIVYEASCVIKDENLRALILLPEILPNSNFKTGAKEDGRKKNGKRIKLMETNNIKQMPNADLLCILKIFQNVGKKLRKSSNLQKY
ncbi:uncharacterized protein LOC122508826 [Leptopilina heterotoma]|uniref:uncharacterized protein LOC122508826 n=1 Tax=Leptopilina heterotoma TaxID=63436 RepID=UPI001CA9AB8A|nr:uncharacterized protein LOC122508826 [Leptopilina heterotoma]XP_043478328.1 uncharacterized protein LOC122508826 [Leptopilina heterotoma]XP_043478329.1 uncharacterized protein LOC122508826 [Leptopilina heterotoma]